MFLHALAFTCYRHLCYRDTIGKAERPTDIRSLRTVSPLLDSTVRGLLLLCRLSAIWSAARVCRHGWFDSKGGSTMPCPVTANA
nr:MAG TPA: hypothetical protein [Caudoviricetes sp.]